MPHFRAETPNRYGRVARIALGAFQKRLLAPHFGTMTCSNCVMFLAITAGVLAAQNETRHNWPRMGTG
jgi:hypothetical protein